MHPSGSPLFSPKVVEKPWGREIWYAEQADYAGKLLYVRKGGRLSLQFHRRKVETLYLLRGEILLTYQPADEAEAVAPQALTTYLWGAGLALHVPARTLHRFEALEDSELLEVSTPYLGDVVRLSDDYGRQDGDGGC
jgi:mannose-6-phosphate isomerase-like protein (cupin superfamily)